MNKLIRIVWLFFIPFGFSMASDVDIQTRADESREVVQQFAKKLVGELKRGMKEGGPTKAIEVCKILAPAIAQEESSKRGWDIGRTSTKLRNPNNAPDEWESQVLAQFEKRLANGESPMGMSHYEVVTQNGKQAFRFMSPIVVPPLEKAPCLMCHGENIAPDIAAKLDSLYPQDNARGYRAGMLRGAFTITQPIN